MWQKKFLYYEVKQERVWQGPELSASVWVCACVTLVWNNIASPGIYLAEHERIKAVIHVAAAAVKNGLLAPPWLFLMTNYNINVSHRATGCQINTGSAIRHRSAPDLGLHGCQGWRHSARFMPSAVTEPCAHNHCLKAERQHGLTWQDEQHMTKQHTTDHPAQRQKNETTTTHSTSLP